MTERAWSEHAPQSLDDYEARRVGGADWQRNTRWSGGLTDAEVSAAEEKWGIRFPPDYRSFLQQLGATDRPRQGAGFEENGRLSPREGPGFYDWRTDDDAIRAAMARPAQGLLFDVEQNELWLDSWGPRPDSEAERGLTVRTLVSDAPTLIPVFGHRYLLGEPCEGGNPVLSVYQSDLIVYGRELHVYLMLEMATLLSFDRQQMWEDAQRGVTTESLRAIPFWGEFLT